MFSWDLGKVMSQEIVVDIRIGKWKFKTGYIPGRDVPLYRLCIFFNIVQKGGGHSGPILAVKLSN